MFKDVTVLLVGVSAVVCVFQFLEVYFSPIKLRNLAVWAMARADGLVAMKEVRKESKEQTEKALIRDWV